MHPDAKRLAARFVAVATTLEPDRLWDDDLELVTATFDELLRAEVIFGGPSLYADPAV